MLRNLACGRGARVQKKSSFSARKKPFAFHFRPQLEALESRDLLSGTGLMAEYFNSQTLTGTPALVRTDANVNFSWSTGSVRYN